MTSDSYPVAAPVSLVDHFSSSWEGSCLNSHSMTSSIVSSSSLNRSFLNFSYVSLSTRICGNFDCGDPFFPGIVSHKFKSHLKTVSIPSTHLLTESE